MNKSPVTPTQTLISETLALAKEREEAIEACLSGVGKPTYTVNTDWVVERSGKLAEMLAVACEALQGYAEADDDDVESAPITRAAREALAQIDRIASGQAAGKEE